MTPTPLQPLKIEVLRQRSEFLRLKAEGQRVHKTAFVLQIQPRPERKAVAVGYTASTKGIGNAVARNRARRRLRAAVASVAKAHPLQGKGWELALIARLPVLEQDFTALVADLAAAWRTAGLIN